MTVVRQRTVADLEADLKRARRAWRAHRVTCQAWSVFGVQCGECELREQRTVGAAEGLAAVESQQRDTAIYSGGVARRRRELEAAAWAS